MVTHIVLWKLKAEAEGRNKAENARLVVEALQSLPAQIPSLIQLEVGQDFERSSMAWDLALYTKFTSKEDLAKYQQHPAHLKVAALVKSVICERAVVDFIS